MSRDWLGDLINKDVPLKGMGKPLSREVLEGDVLDRTVKNAGYRPGWVGLQQQIRDRLAKVLPLLENRALHNEKITQEVEEINILVKKYNSSCPPPMQKMLISIDDIPNQMKRWE
ncbi:DUF1992 domain-containing protein [Anaerobacillus alkaliphilus]|uniref:DUF1992 domain-containing protein n=1 Tax=Anaerobacillus alkaliphilus TaxID=1548597 RepID=A0A4Q0VZT2_9BACI|nr:DUF1992 domain-containing protein [Anaerobacillus alkaliphilus]RXJ04091.1 DUF1992 domain-containing protein [Anaerobacillus alkaliphilus]